MTSDELNTAIAAMCDRPDLAKYDSGKCIPYIGWFWREVVFDAPAYSFGIIPGGFVGFMENSKFGYSYTRETTPEEWKEIKRLLEVAVENPTPETTQAVWDAVQAIRGEP